MALQHVVSKKPFSRLPVAKIPHRIPSGTWVPYEIIVDNSGNQNTLSNYQILLNIVNDSRFFQDVQNRKYLEFYDSDLEPLNHYVEEWDTINNNAKIWIKTPYIPAGEKKKIYLAVNPFRTEDLSDGSKVFDFFDDFDILDTSKWSIESGSPTVSDSILNFTASVIRSVQEFSYPIILEFKASIEDNYNSFNRLENAVSGNHIQFTRGAVYPNHVETAVAGTRYILSVGIDLFDGTFHIYKIYWKNNKVLWYLDESLANSQTDPAKIPTDNMTIVLASSGTYTPYSLCDWVRVRKYADPEPTVSYVKI